MTVDCAGKGIESQPGHEGHQLQHHWWSFSLSRIVLHPDFVNDILTCRRLLGSVASRP